MLFNIFVYLFNSYVSKDIKHFLLIIDHCFMFYLKYVFLAYKTVSGVNGPLVILDGVKVNILL